MLVILILLAGLVLLFYPQISNYFAQRNASTAVQEYKALVGQWDDALLEEELDKAHAYNAELRPSTINDPFGADRGPELNARYRNLLALNETMAILSIPKIAVTLPVVHGTHPRDLERRVGHLEGSSLPVGGPGTHAVLTGHTGLSSVKLLSDMSVLALGDLFFIQVLNMDLAYEIDQIIVVEPHETQALAPVPGKDYLTLITCTPYGINSHRLLVRGTRVPFSQELVEAETAAAKTRGLSEEEQRLIFAATVTGAVMLVLIFIVLLIVRRKRKKEEEEAARAKKEKERLRSWEEVGTDEKGEE